MNERRAWAQWEREAIFAHYGNKCLNLLCHSKENLCLDHVVSLARNGKDEVSNIQVLCVRCNTAKGKQTIDFRDQDNILTHIDKREKKARAKPGAPRKYHRVVAVENVPPEHIEALKERAKADRRSFASYMRVLIEDALQNGPVGDGAQSSHHNNNKGMKKE